MTFKNFIYNTLECFKKVVNWIFSNLSRFLIIILLILSTVFYFKYKNYETKYINVIAETADSLTTYQNKISELYVQNNAYITDIKNLKDANNDLYNEIKNLKDNPIVITKIETIYKRDTLTVTNDISCDENQKKYKFDFAYKDDWSCLTGYTNFNVPNLTSSTTFTDIKVNSNIYVDLIEDGKNLKIIAKSDNPYLQINNLDGIILSPENSKLLKERFNKKWCVVGGIGISTTLYNNQVIFYPSLNLTIGYKLISF